MDYNTDPTGYLVDLDGLHRLRAERSAAGYDRGERLMEWLVLGRFMLDTCGNFGRADVEHVEWARLPPVVAPKELYRMVKGASIGWSGFMPPQSSDVCRECGHGWTIENCHDAEEVHRTELGETLLFEHRGCRALRLQREEIEQLTRIARLAGLEKAVVRPIPDEYWPDKLKSGSWVLLCTPWGEIKMGWRKSVISISWADLVARATAHLQAYENWDARDAIRKALDGNELFANEDATKDSALIHAWGESKAITHLKVIADAIRKLVPRG